MVFALVKSTKILNWLNDFWLSLMLWHSFFFKSSTTYNTPLCSWITTNRFYVDAFQSILWGWGLMVLLQIQVWWAVRLAQGPWSRPIPCTCKNTYFEKLTKSLWSCASNIHKKWLQLILGSTPPFPSVPHDPSLLNFLDTSPVLGKSKAAKRPKTLSVPKWNTSYSLDRDVKSLTWAFSSITFFNPCSKKSQSFGLNCTKNDN